jgi:hypothetical protein
MKFDDVDDPRRDFLVKALTAGAFAMGSNGLVAPVWAMGKIPKIIPPGKSIFDLRGQVTVNKIAANLDTFIKPGDVVETRGSSHAVFVVGKDAFILRSNSRMQIEGSTIVNTLRLFSGKVLSVFGHRKAQNKLTMRSTTATIGIRGTGVYMEADPEKTYLCTCYGETEIISNVDQNVRERIAATHHDAPKYILAKPVRGKIIQPGPMINHSDDELMLVEELVGREVPFGLEGDEYQGPRRDY